MDPISTARYGMMAATQQLTASANRVAAGGDAVDYATEPVNLIGAKQAFKANDGVIKVADEALGGELDLRVLGSAAPDSKGDDKRFQLVAPFWPRSLDGVAFWLALPVRTARMLREFRPEAIFCQTAYEAAAALVDLGGGRFGSLVIAQVRDEPRAEALLQRVAGARVGDELADEDVFEADVVADRRHHRRIGAQVERGERGAAGGPPLGYSEKSGSSTRPPSGCCWN